MPMSRRRTELTAWLTDPPPSSGWHRIFDPHVIKAGINVRRATPAAITETGVWTGPDYWAHMSITLIPPDRQRPGSPQDTRPFLRRHLTSWTDAHTMTISLGTALRVLADPGGWLGCPIRICQNCGLITDEAIPEHAGCAAAVAS